MRRLPLAAVLVLPLAGCLGGGEEPPERTAAPQVLAQAPPSATAGTLAQVADVRAARERLAYVNLDALAAAELPVPRSRVLARVLGAGARVVAAREPGATAVQVGRAATVLHGGGSPVVVGARPALAARLRDTRPETNAIAPAAPSAAQSCLGDTLAQVILGPAAMGRDSALGVGLAESGDAPAGLQLRICGAPRRLRDIHATEQRLARRFGAVPSRVGETELGEREIVHAVVAAGAVPPRELLRLLSAGPELRALAWR